MIYLRLLTKYAFMLPLILLCIIYINPCYKKIIIDANIVSKILFLIKNYSKKIHDIWIYIPIDKLIVISNESICNRYFLSGFSPRIIYIYIRYSKWQHWYQRTIVICLLVFSKLFFNTEVSLILRGWHRVGDRLNTIFNATFMYLQKQNQKKICQNIATSATIFSRHRFSLFETSSGDNFVSTRNKSKKKKITNNCIKKVKLSFNDIKSFYLFLWAESLRECVCSCFLCNITFRFK